MDSDVNVDESEETTNETAELGSEKETGKVLPAARIRSERKGERKRRSRQPLGKRIKRRWRAWLRSIHRDIGYLAVGLTFVYALSGIAINHIGSWDPNFSLETASHSVPLPISADDEEAATKKVLAALRISEEPRDFFFETEEQLEIYFDDKERTLIVDITTGRVKESYKSERFFIRVANWLHYNRGKSAWTYIADGYAFFLLFLATSGIFMLKGRKGLIGRGAILIAMGAAVPILYVHFASGP